MIGFRETFERASKGQLIVVSEQSIIDKDDLSCYNECCLNKWIKYNGIINGCMLYVKC